jgi:hypothetical protein
MNHEQTTEHRRKHIHAQVIPTIGIYRNKLTYIQTYMRAWAHIHGCISGVHSQEMRNAFQIFNGEPEGKLSLWRPSYDNIK